MSVAVRTSNFSLDFYDVDLLMLKYPPTINGKYILDSEGTFEGRDAYLDSDCFFYYDNGAQVLPLGKYYVTDKRNSRFRFEIKKIGEK